MSAPMTVSEAYEMLDVTALRLSRMRSIYEGIERDGDIPGPRLEQRMRRRLDAVEAELARVRAVLKPDG